MKKTFFIRPQANDVKPYFAWSFADKGRNRNKDWRRQHPSHEHSNDNSWAI